VPVSKFLVAEGLQFGDSQTDTLGSATATHSPGIVRITRRQHILLFSMLGEVVQVEVPLRPLLLRLHLAPHLQVVVPPLSGDNVVDWVGLAVRFAQHPIAAKSRMTGIRNASEQNWLRK
jgi:hypothetical protein